MEEKTLPLQVAAIQPNKKSVQNQDKQKPNSATKDNDGSNSPRSPSDELLSEQQQKLPKGAKLNINATSGQLSQQRLAEPKIIQRNLMLKNFDTELEDKNAKRLVYAKAQAESAAIRTELLDTPGIRADSRIGGTTMVTGNNSNHRSLASGMHGVVQEFYIANQEGAVSTQAQLQQNLMVSDIMQAQRKFYDNVDESDSSQELNQIKQIEINRQMQIEYDDNETADRIHIQQQYPNLKIDVNQKITDRTQKYLMGNTMFNRDGSITVNGIHVRGAPQLAKFNPNFKVGHQPKPNSRGLTQGNLLQMATQALAALPKQRRRSLFHGQSPQQRLIMHGRKKTVSPHVLKKEVVNNDLAEQFDYQPSKGTLDENDTFGSGRRFIKIQKTDLNKVSVNIDKEEGPFMPRGNNITASYQHDITRSASPAITGNKAQKVANTSDRVKHDIITSHETANRANSSIDNELPNFRGSVNMGDKGEAVVLGDSIIQRTSYSRLKNHEDQLDSIIQKQGLESSTKLEGHKQAILRLDLQQLEKDKTFSRVDQTTGVDRPQSFEKKRKKSIAGGTSSNNRTLQTNTTPSAIRKGAPLKDFQKLLQNELQVENNETDFLVTPVAAQNKVKQQQTNGIHNQTCMISGSKTQQITATESKENVTLSDKGISSKGRSSRRVRKDLDLDSPLQNQTMPFYQKPEETKDLKDEKKVTQVTEIKIGRLTAKEKMKQGASADGAEILNQDQDYENLMMKPKGIEIFQHDLMSREEESKNLMDEKPTTYIAVENQNVESALPANLHIRDSAKMSAFNIDPKSSIFTSSNNQAENSLILESGNRNGTKETARNEAVILGEISSAMNSHEIRDHDLVDQNVHGFKKSSTAIGKKKKKEEGYTYNKADLAEMSPSQRRLALANKMVDIDEVQYTEISSNANSINKSEILMRQINDTAQTEKVAQEFSDQMYDDMDQLPLSNQTLKDKKQVSQPNQDQLTPNDSTKRINETTQNTKVTVQTELAFKDPCIMERQKAITHRDEKDQTQSVKDVAIGAQSNIRPSQKSENEYLASTFHDNEQKDRESIAKSRDTGPTMQKDKSLQRNSQADKSLARGSMFMGEQSYKPIHQVNVYLGEKEDSKSKRSFNLACIYGTKSTPNQGRMISDPDRSERTQSIDEHSRFNLHTNMSYQDRYRTQKFESSELIQLIQNNQHRRLIMKSPNPNDTKKILFGDNEFEADVLLNGTVYSGEFKQSKKPDILTKSEHKQLKQNQIMRQLEWKSDNQKRFELSGKQIAANQNLIKAQFEHVYAQPDLKIAVQEEEVKTVIKHKNSQEQLKAHLEKLSLNQLQQIIDLQAQGAIIVKNKNRPDSQLSIKNDNVKTTEDTNDELLRPLMSREKVTVNVPQYAEASSPQSIQRSKMSGGHLSSQMKKQQLLQSILSHENDPSMESRRGLTGAGSPVMSGTNSKDFLGYQNQYQEVCSINNLKVDTRLFNSKMMESGEKELSNKSEVHHQPRSEITQKTEQPVTSMQGDDQERNIRMNFDNNRKVGTVLADHRPRNSILQLDKEARSTFYRKKNPNLDISDKASPMLRSEDNTKTNLIDQQPIGIQQAFKIPTHLENAINTQQSFGRINNFQQQTTKTPDDDTLVISDLKTQRDRAMQELFENQNILVKTADITKSPATSQRMEEHKFDLNKALFQDLTLDGKLQTELIKQSSQDDKLRDQLSTYYLYQQKNEKLSTLRTNADLINSSIVNPITEQRRTSQHEHTQETKKSRGSHHGYDFVPNPKAEISVKRDSNQDVLMMMATMPKLDQDIQQVQNLTKRPKSQGIQGTKMHGRRTFLHSDLNQYQQFMQLQKNQMAQFGDSYDMAQYSLGQQTGSTVNIGDDTQRLLHLADKEAAQIVSRTGILSDVSRTMKNIFSARNDIDNHHLTEDFSQRTKTMESRSKSLNIKKQFITKGYSSISANTNKSTSQKPRRNIQTNFQTLDSKPLYQQFFTPACRLINQQRFMNNIETAIKRPQIQRKMMINLMEDKMKAQYLRDDSTQLLLQKRQNQSKSMSRSKETVAPQKFKSTMGLSKPTIQNNATIMTDHSFKIKVNTSDVKRKPPSTNQATSAQPSHCGSNRDTARVLLSKTNCYPSGQEINKDLRDDVLTLHTDTMKS